jgi:hypothetical protein
MRRIAIPLCLLVLTTSLRAADAPAVTIDLGNRQGEGRPARQGFTHTGGGNIDVQQPAPDTVVITMTGVAVAGGHPCKDSLAAISFDLAQEFEVSFAKPTTKSAKLTIEARVIGLLRSHQHGCGSASINCPAHAAVSVGGQITGPALVELNMPGRSVAAGENLSVNDRQGPIAVKVTAGKYTLHQHFGIQATHPKKLLPCKAASAEFAPDPALDPLWISAFEPFHGAIKKDFGFQVTVKVASE